jgi:DMSO/TMAO reductase YedYZ molybdopterin-dependent catalytic subunit
MAVVTRGFGGRRGPSDHKLPPGQYETRDFPVLSAGPTPLIARDNWKFTLTTETGEQHTWNWSELMALPQQSPTVDIHCVTKWSKFGTSWRGVAIDTLLEGIATSAEYATAHSYGGYTTNLPLADLLDGKAWITHEYDGQPLPAAHGGPARLLVPHLYFWKSAKWVNGLTLMTEDRPGFWEGFGYHNYGDPWREQRYDGD